MSKSKTYYSLGAFPLSVDIPKEGGGHVTFDFTGGFRQPTFKAPTYRTSDKKEQELLENYSMFNKSYALMEVYEPIESQGVVEPLFVKKEFATINEARDFMAENGIAKTKMPNPNSIINAGKQKGFEIVIQNVNN